VGVERAAHRPGRRVEVIGMGREPGRLTLGEADRRTLAVWAADCAERTLPLFEARAPNDRRPRDAIDGLRAFARGEMRIGKARVLSAAAHAAGGASAIRPRLPRPTPPTPSGWRRSRIRPPSRRRCGGRPAMRRRPPGTAPATAAPDPPSGHARGVDRRPARAACQGRSGHRIRRRGVRVTSGHASPNDPAIPNVATRNALASPVRPIGRSSSSRATITGPCSMNAA
jgi:Imm-5 like putative immunity protein